MVTRNPGLPPLRPLKAFRFDPSQGHGSRSMTINVPVEPLLPGPISDQIAVIDYDGHGNALVSREVLHDLLPRAVYRQEPIPPPSATVPGAGRARLRKVAADLTTPPAEPTTARGQA